MHLQSSYFGGRTLEQCSLMPVWGDTPLIGASIVKPLVIYHKERERPELILEPS